MTIEEVDPTGHPFRTVRCVYCCDSGVQFVVLHEEALRLVTKKPRAKPALEAA